MKRTLLSAANQQVEQCKPWQSRVFSPETRIYFIYLKQVDAIQTQGCKMKTGLVCQTEEEEV